MARESRAPQTPANLRTFSQQLREFAASLDAAATVMETLGFAQVVSTHANAITLGMKQVDGFCAAIREAIRETPQGKPVGKRVRLVSES